MRKKLTVIYSMSDLPRSVRNAIKRYVDAYDDNSWMSGGDPSGWPQIEQELKDAKQHLIHTLLQNLKKPRKKKK